MKRPTSVTVIAWLLIASSLISLVSSYASMDNPQVRELMSKSLLPLSVQYAMMFASLAMMVTTGVAMLKGLGWGRLVYFSWSVLGLVVGLLTSPIKTTLIPGVIALAIFAYFLYRPKANAYFSGQAVADDA
ncbi:hypothetical protein GTP81_01815 [Rugamonas sp. FT107W]|uniref:DUF4345 domain-containing protein n=1 Tax=Duganella vulcania TaxID=2692166 RepID=A0A845H8Z8_9BURK|nr:hypothetical protein [Duganella vulcania]MYN15482.1 hypothetical protein [Duganella vulcania]